MRRTTRRVHGKTGDHRRTLAGIGLFAGLDDAARRDLERRCTWNLWSCAEQIIDRQTLSNDVYFVIYGRAHVVDYGDTRCREVIFDEIGPGGCFGELAAIDGEPRSANIVACEETLTAALAAPAFIDTIFEHRAVGLAFIRRLSEVVRQSTARIMDLSTLGAHDRICAELLRLAKTGGGRPPNTAVVEPIPSHSEIAARVSTTRETVTRVLGELVHGHLLQRESDALNILNVTRLTELARSRG